jgi:hypothetical protein
METRVRLSATVLVGVLALLSATACRKSRGEVGALKTEVQNVETGGAQAVRAELKMAAGDLKLSSGAGGPLLTAAQFSYNVAGMKPEVSYDVTDGRGALVIEEPSTGMFKASPTKARYAWDLKLNGDVPLDLEVNIGAGRSRLDMRGLMLKSLSVHAGVGECDVDLTGDWRGDADVKIEGGMGRVRVRLPRAVGVRAHVLGGLGAVHTTDLSRDGDYYVNSVYGKSPKTLALDITGGVGEVDLEVETPAR